METAFDHERLEVYQVAVEFVGLADGIIEALPKGRAYLADQLQRAATSIVLNIAEGAGDRFGPDKARFYRMARRSATECAGVLDVCRTLRASDETMLLQGRELLIRVVQMLVRLDKSVAQAATDSDTDTATT